MTGFHFGRYQILERLSAGGMGVVYRGVAHGADGFKKPVVIKRIHGHLAGDPEMMARFVNEAKLTMAMSHGNLVQVLDLGKLEQEYFIVLEYVEGKDLASVLEQGRKVGDWPPAPLALHVITEVLRGLDYAHRRTDERGRSLGIVHRDVKPANILCSYEGEVKLTDFGIAKALAARHLTQDGMILGSLRYMSPEQAKGEEIDQRSDVFSVGAILYTLLCRIQPFSGDDFEAVARAVINARFLAPEAHGVRLPPQLQQILLTALAREPARRYAAAAAMLADLERYERAQDSVATSSDLRRFMHGLFHPDAAGPGAASAAADALVHAELQVQPAPWTNGGAVSTFVLSGRDILPIEAEDTQAATPRARAKPGAQRPAPSEGVRTTASVIQGSEETRWPEEARPTLIWSGGRGAEPTLLGHARSAEVLPGEGQPPSVEAESGEARAGAGESSAERATRSASLEAASARAGAGESSAERATRSASLEAASARARALGEVVPAPSGATSRIRPPVNRGVFALAALTAMGAGVLAGFLIIRARSAPESGDRKVSRAITPYAGPARAGDVPLGPSGSARTARGGMAARDGAGPARTSGQVPEDFPKKKVKAKVERPVSSPPPAASKARAKGWVHVSTQPAYAEVFLGEHRLEGTPCRIQLPVGSHVLKLVNRKLGLVVRRRVVVHSQKETRVVIDNFE
jgi:hypothetical protein